MLGLGVEGLEASHCDLPNERGAGGGSVVMRALGLVLVRGLGDCRLGGSGG